MHSTSSSVNMPSSVVPPALMPSVCSACSSSSHAPISWHEMFEQMLMQYVPTGSNLNIS